MQNLPCPNHERFAFQLKLFPSLNDSRIFEIVNTFSQFLITYNVIATVTGNVSKYSQRYLNIGK